MFLLIFLTLNVHFASSNFPALIDGFTGKVLDCYECHSNQPGCGIKLNWLIQRWIPCGMKSAKCVKIYDNRSVTGAQYTKKPEIIRGCLKNVEPSWSQMPTLRENGCWSDNGHYIGTGYKFSDSWTGYIFCFCNNRDGCNTSAKFLLNLTAVMCSVLLLLISS